MKYKPTTAANFFEDADGAAAVPLTKERPHYFATEISAGLSFLFYVVLRVTIIIVRTLSVME